MKDSEFVLLIFIYCIINVIKNLNHGGSYIDSHDLIINKKPTINPINKKDNKCLQYCLAVTLSHE